MSQDPAFFETLYDNNPDPWGFETSAYERAKYDATLAALPPARFASALEVGCSIGVFTARLATRCDALLGLDVSAKALERAQAHCAGLANVTLQQRAVPAQWPAGRYDLMVLSEVLYFLDADDIAATAARAGASLQPGGCVVLVNWLGETDTPVAGDAAADLFLAGFAGARAITTRRQPQYRLDVLLS